MERNIHLIFPQFLEIEKKTGKASYNSTQPDFIYEVTYHESSTPNARFDELSQTYETLYAYHGSRLDNFHSILHNGLHAHLNKVRPCHSYLILFSVSNQLFLCYSILFSECIPLISGFEYSFSSKFLIQI